MCTKSAIIENTPDVITWLEENGYKLSKYFTKDLPIIFTNVVGLYGTIRYEDIERYTSKEQVVGGRKDCRGQKTLFITTVANPNTEYLKYYQ